MILVALFAPMDRPHPDMSPLRELRALRLPQVWLTLGIGAIGFGGMFAVYTYLASTLMAVTHVSPCRGAPGAVHFRHRHDGRQSACACCGRSRLDADCRWPAALGRLYPGVVSVRGQGNIWLVGADVLLIGLSVAMGTVLQIRLMDVAEDAQSLAAALNHSAFNTANALGPWLGGMAIAAGYGWTSTGWVGSALALGGLRHLVPIGLARKASPTPPPRDSILE